MESPRPPGGVDCRRVAGPGIFGMGPDVKVNAAEKWFILKGQQPGEV